MSQPIPVSTKFVPTPEGIQAVLTALIMQYGEPLVQPVRIQLSISRPSIDAAAGRKMFFEYVQDELNPHGRLDVIVME